MRRDQFHIQLLAATHAALQRAHLVCEKRFSMNISYVVFLNQSYDGNRKEYELVYPDDSKRVEQDLSETEVVELLYRDGRCPQWIDIWVAGADRSSTLMCLTCCGRYHDNDERLYYYEQGTQPFGIKLPTCLPMDWKQGDKVSLDSPKKALASLLQMRKGKV